MKVLHSDGYNKFYGTRREIIRLTSYNIITGLRYYHRRLSINRSNEIRKRASKRRFYVYYHFAPI
jgi:hypothetical protein